MHPEMRDIQSVLGAIGRAEPPEGLRDRIMRACAEAEEPVAEISCEECLELASEYVDDELSGTRRDSFEAHVFACDACYVAFKQMERTAEILRSTPAATVPAHLHARITAAVADGAGAESIFTWRRAAKVLGGLAAAAALLAAVFVPRGHDGDGTRGAIAELPPETAAEAVLHAEPVEEPMTPPATPEGTGDAAAHEAEESTPAEAAETSPVRRETGTRITRRIAVDAERVPDPEPTLATAVTPEPAAREPELSVRPQPRPERTETPAARRETPQPSRPERRVPEPQPEPQPVTADESPQPQPTRDTAPEVAPDPPAREPAPRDTVIAAIPRDPEPQPTSVSEPETQPRPATTTTHAPRPGADREPTRLAVVPRRPRSRAVYQPEPTPVAERSERLARMAESINGSQTPRLDNPPSGIELN